MQYSAPIDRTLIVTIYAANGKAVGSERFSAYAGFANNSYSVGAKLKSGEKYTAVAYIVNEGSKKSKKYITGDSFNFTAK